MKRKILIAILSLCFSNVVRSAEGEAPWGVYLSNTESDCEIQITLDKSGAGEATQICVLEDGSHKLSTTIFPISWVVSGIYIHILHAKNLIVLAYDNALPCDDPIGNKGIGFVLVTKEENLFDGYHEKFFKKGAGCL